MPSQHPLTQPKLLLVEGIDEVNFFNSTIKHLNLHGLEVRDYGGKIRLSPYLRTTLKLISGFRNVQSVGIIRDADVDADDAFDSVCDGLLKADLPVPNVPLATASGHPKIAVMIMPPGEDAGMLEDLCLSAFQADPAMLCVDQYFQCVADRMGSVPRNMVKAKIHAFLASREPPDLRLGQAVGKDFWPWDSSAFEPVRQFISHL